MTLRLNGSTSGYTEIDAPAVAGNNNLKLPTGNGSANQFLKNGATAGTLGWSSLVEDSSGRLLVGASSSSDNVRLVVQGRATTDPTGQGVVHIQRGSSAPGVAMSGSGLGEIHFADSNGYIAASLLAAADGAWGAGGNDYPGRLVLSTTADGASSPTERMRIDSAGNVLVGKTSTGSGNGLSLEAVGVISVNRGSATPCFFNRNTNDGVIVSLQQDGIEEGTISVSGTTVAYNGAHLSRWAQLPGGAERTEILRGTILSNIDEMCVWGEEDNEQLNRMKVSDVEGDPNVAGVFQGWDDDDDTYTDDFYCAMTGDFIIRIAEGVTVQRGDLLMSAGDGTAKPQGDDIVRSKTVAKVTSTHVTCTYEDGSYCVPCVLMAC
jgi:hypothetical protein